MKLRTMKNVVQYLILVLLIFFCAQTANQQPIDQREENGSELWMMRYNRPVAKEYFVSSTSPDGFIWKTSKVKPESEELYVYYHLKLKGPVEGLTFDYNATGDASLMPISLLDAAANELWRFDGQGGSTKKVELNDLKVRGQIVFRIGSGKSVEWPAGWSHAISNLNITVDNKKPVPDSTGFILVDNITEFRGYAGEDHVKIRLKPGTYQIDKAFCTRFIEFTGQHSYYDLNGASIMVDTRLFSQTSLARGSGEKTLYCVLELLGDHSTMEGLYVETYGDQPGIQSKNKVFNITGTGVTLRNAELRTSGSSPWGYGSFYGLGGGDVRKMNGIRVGWPAKDVKLIGCRVHMRAMGHAIFVQGAENTLIEDCHVDGLLRTTNDILAETSGYAFDRDFKAGKGGYVEGVTVAEDGKFLPGEMFSLSEDGIRMYPMMGREHLTGSTRIINCTVDKMRRGICTGLSTAGDMVINSQVTNCIATGFNVGNSDTLINCRADALYAEAFCIPYTDAHNAMVDMEILDSRRGMKNNLLAKINGTDHRVTVRTSDSSFIPDNLAIELSTPKGYGTYSRSPAPNAENIRLSNQTPARVLLLPGTINSQIESEGKVEKWKLAKTKR